MKKNPGRKMRRQFKFASASKESIGIEIVALRKELIKKSKKLHKQITLKPIDMNDIENKYTKNSLFQIRAEYRRALEE